MGDAAPVRTDAWVGGAGGLPGAALPQARADSLQAKGKHLNSLTFELPGTLFTLAARVAVLQILNTVLRGIRGLLKSPPPVWGLAWAQAGLARSAHRRSAVCLPGTRSQRGPEPRSADGVLYFVLGRRPGAPPSHPLPSSSIS